MNITTFTLAYWCVLVVAIMPIVCAGIAKSGMFSKPPSQGGYDNNNPRAWLAQQSAWRARANAAQVNSFEAMPFFFAAVIIAHQLGAVQSYVDILAIAFVVLRIVYIALYIAGKSNLRSIVWCLGLFVNIGILLIGYK